MVVISSEDHQRSCNKCSPKKKKRSEWHKNRWKLYKALNVYAAKRVTIIIWDRN